MATLALAIFFLAAPLTDPPPPPPPSPAGVEPAPVAAPRICPSKEAMRYYPAKAQKTNVEGSAKVMCDVASDGRLSQCTVKSETPEGYDFGETAAMLAECLYRQPGGHGRIEIPLKFRLPPRGAR